jgi:uncharacterized protein (TIGR02646 family)
MKYLVKGKEPHVLTTYRESGETWDDFSLAKGKKEVKNQLLTEQANQCAYCTQSISFDSMKVEHWFPRNPSDILEKEKGESLQLNFKNIFAVCQGCIGKEQHCDTHKAEKIITISPLSKYHIDSIRYNKKGEMISSNSALQDDIDSVLRLNIDELKEVRSRVLKRFIIILERKTRRKRIINFPKLLDIYQRKNEPMNRIIITYIERKVSQFS